MHGLCDITGRAINPGAAQVPPGGSSKSENCELVTIEIGKTNRMMSSIGKPEAIFEGRIPPQEPETKVQGLLDKVDKKMSAARG